MYQREVMLYTRGRSLRCWRAKRLLKRQGYQFEIIDITDNPTFVAELGKAVQKRSTLPYFFVGHRPVGNFDVVKALSNSGDFKHLIRDDI